MNNQPDPNNKIAGIASAPGDLPVSALQERLARKATQFRHDNTIRPTAPTPTQAVTVTATSGAAVNLTRAELWYTTDGSWPGPHSPCIPMTPADMEWTPLTRFVNQWQAVIPPQPDGTTVRYKIAGYTADSPTPTHFAHDGSGFWFYIGEKGITTFAYRVKEQPKTLPDWMADAVIYQIFLDRFHPGTADGAFPPDLNPNARHGGTLRGVTQSLSHISGLGFNCLWLSPLGPSETYHRYDQTDFFGVDPDLGTEADLRELVSAAHQLGMRLILDFVPSHCSWDMPEFAAARRDQNADTYSWFVFDEWPNKYRCFMNAFPRLVSFNSEDEGARRYLIDSALYWLNDMGFDGLRLDHSIGHGMDFWVQFSNELERARPDVALFGEATDTPDNLRRYHGRLQGYLDFPLAQALRLSFGRGYWGVGELAGALEANHRYMQDGPGRVTFFDNHDMNRFLFEAGNDPRRLKLAALCLLTLPYTPVIYYGTEIGLPQDQDKDAAGWGGDSEIRRDMIWDTVQWDTDLLIFFNELIGLRHRYRALRRGAWRPFVVNAEKQVYGYRVSDETAELLILFNLNDSPQQITLEGIKTAKTRLSANGIIKVTLTDSAGEFSLPALGGGVFVAPPIKE